MEDGISTVAEDVPTAKPSHAVVNRVADLEETRPEELAPPLYSAIDPEALDAFFDSLTGPSKSAGEVSFTYCGYEVRVGSDGTVAVAES